MIKGWVFETESEAQKHCDKLHESLSNVDGYDAVRYGFPIKHHSEDLWFIQYVDQYSSNLPEATHNIDKEEWFPEDDGVDEIPEMTKRFAPSSTKQNDRYNVPGSSVRESWHKRLIDWFKRILKL